MEKVIIAMSGGVDSGVAAHLCLEKGYECMGATMLLCDKANNRDAEDARRVAADLGIDFCVIDFTDRFEDAVIKKFVESYEIGATPNPCIDCNRYLKFEGLFEKMEELGYDYVATGHYARIEKHNDRYLLKKAADPTKDQSYVLYSMTQNRLSHTLFPLGDLKKSETREIAEEKGLINANKHDSQDICFVPDGDYAGFIERYTKRIYPDGNFVTTDGTILGRHKGIIRYTIGQRKGLGLSLPAPMYVKSKNAEKNEVILCSNEELFSKSLDAENFNWIACDTPKESFTASAKVRYNQKEEPAQITATGENTVHIEFNAPQRAIAKGQAVVVYDGDTVIGGGTII